MYIWNLHKFSYTLWVRYTLPVKVVLEYDSRKYFIEINAILISMEGNVCKLLYIFLSSSYQEFPIQNSTGWYYFCHP